MATRKAGGEDPDKVRARDAKRYRKDRKKRIKAVTEYQKKDRKKRPSRYKARAEVNNAVRDGKMTKPGENSDFHHTGYTVGEPKGQWMDQSKHRRLPKKKP